MTDRERLFRLFLRALGVGGLMAFPFALMPHSWMNAVHSWLGMGRMPDAPIVGYLARSTSAFYAMLGGLFVVVSFDLRRYRPVLCYLGGAALVLAGVLFVTDLTGGMPLYWTLVEGPANAALGGFILTMALRTRPQGA